MQNLAWQPLQCVGRSGGWRPYRRKKTLRHSCAPSSFPLTVDGCTVSQAPIFVARRSWRACNTRNPSSAAVRASSARRWTLLQTVVHPSWRQANWSAVRNSTWPRSAATRCPVTTQDAVQFSRSVCEGSGRANHACLTVRRVTPCSGTPSRSPSNNSGLKVYCSAASTSPKASSTPGVTHCTNAHYCWSDFCSPS